MSAAGSSSPRAKLRASLRDVAKLAGVSTTTASRVLSGSNHPVSSSTRREVLAAAERLNFQPNRLARALVTARSGIIGVIVHDVSDPYFGEIVRGLEDGLGVADYRLLVASTDRDPDKEVAYFKVLVGQQVDGIVLAASSLSSRTYENEMVESAAAFRKQGGAIVVLSEHVVPGPRVMFDNRGVSRDIVGHLVERGHRRIAHLRGSEALMISRRRVEGYREGLAKAGIPYDPALVVDGSYTVEGGSEATRRLLRNTDFTAVFASNDLMAIGATRALLTEGVGVPAEVSVIGFDDIVIAEYAPVPLTTVRMPLQEMGRRGAELMLSVLSGSDPDDLSVDGSLVERSSVAAR